MTTLFAINSWEARILLEACRQLDRQWREIARTTDDENEQADYSNDLGQLDIVTERLGEVAAAAFGEDMKSFSRESVCVAAPALD